MLIMRMLTSVYTVVCLVPEYVNVVLERPVVEIEKCCSTLRATFTVVMLYCAIKYFIMS